MLVDWEIHATAYRGQDERMTAAGIVTRCAELGLTHIGIIDHLAPDRGWPPDALKVIFAHLEKVAVPSGLRVYRGAEVDIKEEGCLPELPKLRAELPLDYCIGSVHLGRGEGTSDEEHARREFELMMRVLKKPCPIDVLGHPWGGRSLERVPETMMRELLQASAALGVGVEVSPRFGAEESDIRLLVRRALEEGTKLAPVSDAHAYEHLGDTVALHALLTEAGAQDDDLWLPSGS